MDYRETISLKDLELQLPTLTSHEDVEQITYIKNGDEEKTSSIIIVGRAMFTFLFCFKNRYNKQSPLTHAFKAEPHFGRLSTPVSHWMPPHWVVFPVRNTTATYRIIAVSWDSKYKQRFSDTDQTEREKLRDRLIKKDHEFRQRTIFD